MALQQQTRLEKTRARNSLDNRIIFVYDLLSGELGSRAMFLQQIWDCGAPIATGKTLLHHCIIYPNRLDCHDSKQTAAVCSVIGLTTLMHLIYGIKAIEVFNLRCTYFATNSDNSRDNIFIALFSTFFMAIKIFGCIIFVINISVCGIKLSILYFIDDIL